MSHDWRRYPYEGGVEYQCRCCGLTVGRDYPTNETELSSGALADLEEEMADLEIEQPCEE